MNKKKLLLIALSVALSIVIAFAILFVIIISVIAVERITYESRTTNTWSFEFTSREEKLSFLSEYLNAPSEILNAEYHIVYHDNSIGLPAPSDWNIRVALQIRPEDVPLWTEGFERIDADEINTALWDELATGGISWDYTDAEYYWRGTKHTLLVAFPNEGIILKAVSSLSYL